MTSSVKEQTSASPLRQPRVFQCRFARSRVSSNTPEQVCYFNTQNINFLWPLVSTLGKVTVIGDIIAKVIAVRIGRDTLSVFRIEFLRTDGRMISVKITFSVCLWLQSYEPDKA